MEKKKLEADKKLINVFTGEDPLDWFRYENGDLVYINQAGQKFTLTPEMINDLTDKKLEEKETAAKKPKPAQTSDPETAAPSAEEKES